MRTYCGEIVVRTKGEGDVVDITRRVEEVGKSQIVNGVAHLYVVGSTAALTTMEFEPGLVHDVRASLERIVPRDAYYKR